MAAPAASILLLDVDHSFATLVIFNYIFFLHILGFITLFLPVLGSEMPFLNRIISSLKRESRGIFS